jgi:hypothetical protein
MLVLLHEYGRFLGAYIMLMIVQSLGWLRFYSVLQNLLFY